MTEKLKKKFSFISGLTAFALLFTPIASNAFAMASPAPEDEVVLLEGSEANNAVTQAAYGVTDDSYGVAYDAYSVTDDSYGVAYDAYSVTDDSYGVSYDVYSVTDDTYGTTDDAYGATDDAYGLVTFSDIQGHWAQDEIEALANEGIINGKPDGIFAPQDDISRAEFTTLIVNALKSYGILTFDDSQAGFTDLEAGAWYVDDVQLAAQWELVKGDHEGKFNPNSKITREEIATILGRAYTFVTDQEISANADQVLSGFADPNAVSPWAKDSVAFLVERNVINGVDGNRIDPKQTCITSYDSCYDKTNFKRILKYLYIRIDRVIRTIIGGSSFDALLQRKSILLIVYSI